MTDEARLKRLTELARRVWPEAEVGPDYGIGGKQRGYSVKASMAAYSDGLTAWHPRALDALEAALLVLAGEPPTWVEQLATDLEQRVAGIRKSKVADPDRAEPLAYAYDWIARELRERAKGET